MYVRVHFKSLDTLDNGKPFKDALGDIQNALSIARYFAGLADKVVGQTIPAGLSFEQFRFYTFLQSVLCHWYFFLLCKNTEQISMKFAEDNHYHQQIK